MTPVVSFKVDNEKPTLEVTLAFSGFLTDSFESDKKKKNKARIDVWFETGSASLLLSPQ